MHRVLENGLNVFLKEDHKAPVAISNLWFAVGSNHEWPGVHGWAHGIEHMMFKGTPRRGPGEVSRQVKQAGGVLNASTGHESTNYFIVVPARNLPAALEIQADVVRNALFDPRELERERGVLVEENNMRRDRHTGGGHTYDDLLELAFREAPYRRSIGGRDESLRQAAREEILRFRDRYYVPGNAALVVVGDFEAGEVMARVTEGYGGWSGPPATARAPLTEPRQESFRYRASTGDVGKTYLKIGWHAPGELHPDTFALKVVQQILGRGRGSRLFQSVRERQGLVAEIGMFEETGPDLGYFVVDAVTDPGRLAKAQAAILAEVERLAGIGVGAAELERAKATLERDVAMGNETVEGQAAALGYYWVMGDVSVADTYLDRVREVTASRVEEAAREYLSLERASMNVFGPRGAEPEPPEEAQAVYRRLRASVGAPAAHPRSRPASRASAETETVSRSVLSNGITLVGRRIRGAPLGAVSVAARSGLCYETPETAGLSTLAQRSMLKGAGGRSAAAIAAGFEALGGMLSPLGSADSTGCFVSVLGRNLGPAWELLSDLLERPEFPAEEVERERKLQLEEIDSLRDNPMRNTMVEFASLAFGAHPYGLPALGTRASTGALTRENLLDWYRRFYTPANLVIAVAGDVEWAEFERRAENLSALPAGTPPRRAASPPARCGERREKIIPSDVAQAVILAGFPGPAADSPDRVAMEVLEHVLSGMGNRMFVELRDRRSLCYFTGFLYRPMREAGLLAAYIGTSPKREAEATEGLLGEMRKVVLEAVSAEELERSQNTLVGNFALGQQTVGALASLYAGSEILGLGAGWPAEYPRRVMAVTRDDLLRVAREWFDLDHYALAVTRPGGPGGGA